MRTLLLVIGSLALVLGACSSKKGGSHAPPPLDKSLLTGKWRNVSEAQFVSAYDFGADGTVKMTILGTKDPIPGRYTWSSDRTLDLEYSKAEDVQKAYEEAVKHYKDGIKDRIQKKQLDSKAGPPMLSAVSDKLPAKETFAVGIADSRFLVLIREGGSAQNFQKAD